MAKINRLHLLLKVIGYIATIGVIMYIIYWLTSPREGFQQQNENTQVSGGELTDRTKDIFFTQFLEIRDILYNHFKVGPDQEPKLYAVEIGGESVNITTENPPNIPANTEEAKKITTTIQDINPVFFRKFTKKIGETLADVIGYYEMTETFAKEINKLPVSQREEYYEKRKDNFDVNNNVNIHSWGYIGALVEKYLQGYPFLYFETQGEMVEEFRNEDQILKPIPKSPNEVIEQRFDTLVLLDLPDPKNPIQDFYQRIHRGYEISLINTKQVLKLLKCYLVDKLNDPFNDEIDCDIEKKNERGISIKGYNVFSLSVNK
jgi:hypothetical protein